MSIKHTIALLCFFLAFSAALAQQENDDEEGNKPAPQPRLVNYIQYQTKPEIYPLTLLEGDFLTKLSIWDREIYTHTSILKNISDKPVKIKNVLSSCPCLTIEKVEDVVLKPGETLPLKFSLQAIILKRDADGSFFKFFFLLLEGYETTCGVLSGKVKTSFSYSPSRAIDLGDFMGDVTSWKRIIKITSHIEDETLALKLPQENHLLNITVNKTAPNIFEVELTPKSSFPRGLFHESFTLEISSSAATFSPIPFQILGQCLGITLAVTSSHATIIKSNIDKQPPTRVSALIALRPPNTSQRSRHSRHSRFSQIKAQAYPMPVSKDENEARPLDKPESWLPFIRELSTTKLPEGVAIEYEPVPNGIKANFILQPSFFVQEQPSVSTSFLYKQQPIGDFGIWIQ